MIIKLIPTAYIQIIDVAWEKTVLDNMTHLVCVWLYENKKASSHKI